MEKRDEGGVGIARQRVAQRQSAMGGELDNETVRQPAALASASLQNHRSPLASVRGPVIQLAAGHVEDERDDNDDIGRAEQLGQLVLVAIGPQAAALADDRHQQGNGSEEDWGDGRKAGESTLPIPEVGMWHVLQRSTALTIPSV